MELLERVGDDAFVATFLRGKLDSSRFGDEFRLRLAGDGRPVSVLRRPDLSSDDENTYRRSLLLDHRQFGRDGLLRGFPDDVRWHRAVLAADELLEIRYVHWDWWLRLSDGTRRPTDAARRIRAGLVPGVTVDEHEPVAAACAKGGQAELIVATTPALEPLVVVEGHFRLTSYALFPELLPPSLELLLGISERMAEWSQW